MNGKRLTVPNVTLADMIQAHLKKEREQNGVAGLY
jgi:hypothetical protein